LPTSTIASECNVGSCFAACVGGCASYARVALSALRGDECGEIGRDARRPCAGFLPMRESLARAAPRLNVFYARRESDIAGISVFGVHGGLIDRVRSNRDDRQDGGRAANDICARLRRSADR
jgi:hypothetical protein